MGDTELVAVLAVAGFPLEQCQHRGRPVWTWTDPRRPDDPQPIDLEVGPAARYLDECLRREGLFRREGR